jgi:AraC family transcriptional regulator of adaptative response/methylated-DNA-[protein]-cysteine methyltransferase
MQTALKNNGASAVRALPISTPEGEFTAYYSARGLCQLEFPSRNGRSRGTSPAPDLPAALRQWHAATTKAVRLALEGSPARSLPPLDLSGGTDFQQTVWRALRKISPGRTRSYTQVAEAIGKPKAVRAVGGACGANPIPVLVPCHRVLAADQHLGGFSAGLQWKRTLLAREGVRTAN